MDKRIQIIYTATGDYKGYFYDFINSCNFFFPDYEKKITILSDGLKEFNGFKIGNISIEHVKFYHLIYPTVNLNKPVFINDVMDETYDYVLYFDADTIFKEVTDYNWESILKELDEGKIIVSKHPFYALKDTAQYWGVKKEDVIKNFFTVNVTEKDSRFASYIEEETYDYLITSFFGGTPKTLKVFNNCLILLAQEDLKKYPYGYHVPRFMDENYANKLCIESKKYNDYPVKFFVGQFSELYDGDNDNLSSVFMYQKGMKNLKTNRQ